MSSHIGIMFDQSPLDASETAFAGAGSEIGGAHYYAAASTVRGFMGPHFGTSAPAPAQPAVQTGGFIFGSRTL